MPETTQAQTIMAFDFGTQKMGMAVGQALIESATPLALFPMKDGIPQLGKLAENHQATSATIISSGLTFKYG